VVKKITKLTPEQVAKFGDWSEQWIKIGLSTEPADFDKATEAALRAYKLCNLDKPMVVLRMSSPYGATLGGALAWAMLREFGGKKVGDQVGDQVWDQVWAQVGAQVWDQVGAQVGAQVRAQVWDQVGAQVWAQVWDQVRAQVGAQVGAQVRAQVGAQVGDQVRAQVGAQVGAQVRDQVWDQVRAQLGDQLRNTPHNSLYTQFDAGFGAWVTFFRDVCGWTNPAIEKFEITETLIKSCGWSWWHENVLAISDRPQFIHRDEVGRLHSEVGPSIAYRDGWALHHWHGVAVPANWIEKRSELDPAEVLKASNVEQRAAGASIVGWPKMVSKLKRRIIDGNPDSDLGALIELTLPGLPEPGRFLQAKCPRNGVICEGVPRVSDIDGLPIETVIAAQAWRVGDPQSEYEHPPRRT
jgi:hypothetical protein